MVYTLELYEVYDSAFEKPTKKSPAKVRYKNGHPLVRVRSYGTRGMSAKWFKGV